MSRSPHDRPCTAQVVGWQHTVLWQTPEQGPQFWVMPQPMLKVTQFFPSAAHVVGEQTPQTFAVPAPPHVAPEALHPSPQSCVIPQPMLIVPQFFPCAAQLVGTHTPQTFAVPPPPQVSTGALAVPPSAASPAAPASLAPAQVPQSWVIPQPMLIVPQFFPCAAQLVGVQTPQTFAVPPPPSTGRSS